MKKLYALLLSAAVCAPALQAETLTVYGDATGTTDALPLNIYYASQEVHNQMIYPASELEAVKGSNIDKIAFIITATGTASNAIWNCNGLNVKMATTTQSSFETATYITEGLTEVAAVEAFKLDNITVPYTLEITLDKPFAYTGDNLLIDVTNVKGNGPRNWKFQGQAQTENTGITQKSTSSVVAFLPTLVVDYSAAASTSAAFSVSSISFPLEFLGEKATSTAKLINTGTTVLSGSLMADNAAFAVEPASFDALQAGESLDLTVTFDPTEAGSFEGTISAEIEGVDALEIKLSGTMVDGPSAVRTLFNQDYYATVVPAGWNAYAEEYYTESGEFSDATTEYSNFATGYSFESATINGFSCLLWNHGNPTPYQDVYTRYYYLVSPMVGGDVVLGATPNDVAEADPYVKAFAATFDMDKHQFTIGDEIELTWDTPLEQGKWSIGKGTAPASSQVALLLKYSAVNFFAADDEKAAVAALEADNADAPVEYFNLQGVRVAAPAAGLYIMRRGTEVSKVIVR